MKIFVAKVTLLHAITKEDKVVDYKQGMTHVVNEWYEGADPNTHYANLYGASEVYLEYYNKPINVVYEGKRLVIKKVE